MDDGRRTLMKFLGIEFSLWNCYLLSVIYILWWNVEKKIEKSKEKWKFYATIMGIYTVKKKKKIITLGNF